jgi:hypothetical protein
MERYKQEKEPKGVQWLRILGPDYEAMADQPTRYTDATGAPVRVGDFHTLCETEAEPVFVALAGMAPDSEEYGLYLGAARAMFDAHFRPDGAV